MNRFFFLIFSFTTSHARVCVYTMPNLDDIVALLKPAIGVDPITQIVLQYLMCGLEHKGIVPHDVYQAEWIMASRDGLFLLDTDRQLHQHDEAKWSPVDLTQWRVLFLAKGELWGIRSVQPWLFHFQPEIRAWSLSACLSKDLRGISAATASEEHFWFYHRRQISCVSQETKNKVISWPINKDHASNTVELAVVNDILGVLFALKEVMLAFNTQTGAVLARVRLPGCLNVMVATSDRFLVSTSAHGVVVLDPLSWFAQLIPLGRDVVALMSMTMRDQNVIGLDSKGCVHILELSV